ncbi:oligosaccharide flippase family protein, partial [bacterium]|nr:oligosaccharide flippase family protein [bacterium]
MKLSPSNITSSIQGAVRHRGAHAVLDQAVISGLNFVTFLLLAKWMTTEAFGGYILTFSVLLFVQTLQHALITRAHNVLGAKAEGQEYTELTQGVVKLVFAFSVVFTLLALVVGYVFHLLTLPTWGDAALSLSVAIIPWLFQDAVRRILYSSNRIAAAALNDLICYGLQVVLILALLGMGVSGSIFLVFVVFGASSLISGLIGILQLRTELSGTFTNNGNLYAVWTRLWNFGKWLTTGEFIGWIGQNGNTWIVGALLGAPLVAGYRAATYVTNLLNPLDLSVSNYLPVKAAQVLQAEGH